MNQSIDIGKAITFYAEDEKWLEKLGIGTALVLISSILSVVLVGLLGFFILAGYCIRLLQNVRDGVAKPLPEWNRWSEDLASGFKLVIAMLVYSLPAIIFGIPVGIGAFIANQGSDSAQLVGLPFMIGGYCLIFVYAIMLWLMTPGISVAFAKDESIGSALRIGSVWAWTRPRIGSVIIVALVGIGVGLVLGIVAPLIGVIACVVGVVVTIPLATLLQSLINYHMYGQMARPAPVVVDAPAPAGPTWFEETLSEHPAYATPESASPTSDDVENPLSFIPGDPTPLDVTPNEIGDIPNRADDRPNLPANPT